MEETIFRQELQKRTTAIEDLLKQDLPAEEGYQKTVIEAMNYRQEPDWRRRWQPDGRRFPRWHSRPTGTAHCPGPDRP